MKTWCCNAWKEFVLALQDVSFPVGEGEISGSVSMECVEEEVNLHFNDGWGFYPTLSFTYCPYCGTKQT